MVAVGAAVFTPEMVIVDFDGGVLGGGGLAGEDLAVEGGVFGDGFGGGVVRLELCGEVGAVGGGDLEGGKELDEEGLLEGVGKAVLVGVFLCVWTLGSSGKG
jgi:hypothetical protein